MNTRTLQNGSLVVTLAASLLAALVGRRATNERIDAAVEKRLSEMEQQAKSAEEEEKTEE